MLSRIAALISAAVVSTVVLAADTRIEFKTTEGTGATGQPQTMFVGHGKVRFDRGTAASAIIDPVAKVMVALDHEKRQFTRIGLTELDQLAKEYLEGIEALRDLVASMPPDERGNMEATLAVLTGGAGDLKFVDTKKTATVVGRVCRVHVASLKDQAISESCEADVAVLDLSIADRDVLVAALAFGQEFIERITKTMMPGLAQQFGSFKAGQISLRTTEIKNGVRHTSEFVSATAGPLSADLFTVPPTYKEQKFGEGFYVTLVVPIDAGRDAHRGRAAIR